MPILNGFEATQSIRDLEKNGTIGTRDIRPSNRMNGRLPIFAVSASLRESQYNALCGYGLDGWILKPIDFKRLTTILRGISDAGQRNENLYHPGGSWEAGGWLTMPPSSPPKPSAESSLGPA
jgi:CheY-like chemotaxis protein